MPGVLYGIYVSDDLGITDPWELDRLGTGFFSTADGTISTTFDSTDINTTPVRFYKVVPE